MTDKLCYGGCSICGNVSSYDSQSLKASTYRINGTTIILCIPCEDDLLKTLAKGRGIEIKYGDGGEIMSIKVKDNSILINGK